MTGNRAISAPFNQTPWQDTIGRGSMIQSDAPCYLPRHLAPILAEALEDTPVDCWLAVIPVPSTDPQEEPGTGSGNT